MPIGIYRRTKPAWNKGKHLFTKGSFKKKNKFAFKKGYTPWNKGIKTGIKNTNKTSFKKGIKHNWIIKGLNKGKDSHNWRGGSSFEPYSIDWTEDLRRAIRKRDKYTCQLCGKEPALHCHHIDYNKKNCNPENLITLCHSCHLKTNGNRKYWKDLLTVLSQDNLR